MVRKLWVIVGVAAVVFGVPASAAQATWSVVGVDQGTGEVGVAVASCVEFEVTVVPVLVPGVGAAASQADISPLSGERLVRMLLSGANAEETVEVVVAADDAPEDRQFGVVVLGGGGAGWTGSDTFDVALDRRGANSMASVQGNILVSEEVVTAAIVGFESSDGSLADRLLAGLTAGADAGGDSRCGDQTALSAALIVARPGDQSYAFTEKGIAGVDPEDEIVPSVFVSVIVEKGQERAPDRLAQAWANADRSAEAVVIRQIDEGAYTAQQGASVVVMLLFGAIVVIAVVAVVWARRHKPATDPKPPPSQLP